MMKKYMAAGIAVISVLGAVAGCGGAGGKDIGKDAALDAALQDAGVTEEDTTRLRTSKDRDDGRIVYEIQFDANGTEYDYEVSAADGTILSVDTESIPNASVQNNAQTDFTEQKNGSGQNTAQSDSGTQNHDSSGQTAQGGQQNDTQNSQQNAGANVAVSQEQAVKTALERVPGATETDIRIELDQDDGQYRYEGDIIYNQVEYEFEIDANTGNVLEWSEERR